MKVCIENNAMHVMHGSRCSHNKPLRVQIGRKV